ITGRLHHADRKASPDDRFTAANSPRQRDGLGENAAGLVGVIVEARGPVALPKRPNAVEQRSLRLRSDRSGALFHQTATGPPHGAAMMREQNPARFGWFRTRIAVDSQHVAVTLDQNTIHRTVNYCGAGSDLFNPVRLRGGRLKQ